MESVIVTFREFISLTEGSAATLGDPIGTVAGLYGATSRRSLVLHLCDELIHHAAEASLLRDLYAGRWQVEALPNPLYVVGSLVTHTRRIRAGSVSAHNLRRWRFGLRVSSMRLILRGLFRLGSQSDDRACS